MKKIISILLLCVMLIGVLPAMSFAANTWSYKISPSGVMTISGKGMVEDPNGLQWHYNGENKKVKKIIVEDGITGISNLAFMRFENLEEVVLGKDCSYIGRQAFCFDERLKKVVFNGEIKEMHQFAFFGCKRLCAVFLGNQTREQLELAGRIIDAKGFDQYYNFNSSCGLTYATYGEAKKLSEGWKWALENGVLTISGYGTVDGKNAADYPWNSKRNEIKKVIVGDGIFGIGDRIFTLCKNLETVVLGKNCTYIGGDAFSYCDKLSSLECNGNLLYVGRGCAYKSTNLKNITLTNQNFEQFKKITDDEDYNFQPHALEGDFKYLPFDTAEYTVIQNLKIEPFEGGFVNWTSSPNKGNEKAVTELLLKITDKRGERIDLSADLDWKVTFKNGNNSKTISMYPSTVSYTAGIYRFEPCLLKDSFVPESGKTYEVSVEVKDGSKLIYKNLEKLEVKVASDFAPIVPATPVVPERPKMPAPYVPEKGTVSDWDWSLVDGVLTITGKGIVDTTVHEDKNEAELTGYPWHEKRGEIKKIVIGDEITFIGNRAFSKCPNLEEIVFGKKCSFIGKDVASWNNALKKLTFRGPVAELGGALTFGAIKDDVIIVLQNQTFRDFYYTAIKSPNNFHEPRSNGIFGGSMSFFTFIETYNFDIRPEGEIFVNNNGKAQMKAKILDMNGNPMDIPESYEWKVSLKDGDSVKTVSATVSSVDIKTGVYVFDLEGFTPIANKNYTVSIEALNNGEKVGSTFNATTGFTVPSDFDSGIVDPEPPATGDATAFVAVLSVVALFGTAIVITKKVLA